MWSKSSNLPNHHTILVVFAEQPTEWDFYLVDMAFGQQKNQQTAQYIESRLLIIKYIYIFMICRLTEDGYFYLLGLQ